MSVGIPGLRAWTSFKLSIESEMGKEMGRPNSPHNNRPFNSWSREGKPFSRSDKEQGWLSKREDAVHVGGWRMK